MSESSEQYNKEAIDKTANAEADRAAQRIEEYIKDAEIESPRFQAFADYVDRIHVEELLFSADSKSENLALWQMERSLICETIRRRQNGVRGYKKEYKRIEDLAGELGSAIHSDSQRDKAGLSHVERLGYIKNTAINTKSAT